MATLPNLLYESHITMVLKPSKVIIGRKNTTENNPSWTFKEKSLKHGTSNPSIYNKEKYITNI